MKQKSYVAYLGRSFCNKNVTLRFKSFVSLITQKTCLTTFPIIFSSCIKCVLYVIEFALQKTISKKGTTP